MNSPGICSNVQPTFSTTIHITKKISHCFIYTEMFTPPEIPISAYTPPQTDIYLPSAKAPPKYEPEYPHKYESYGSPVNTYTDHAYAPIQQYSSPYGTNEFQRAASAGPYSAPSCKKIHHSKVSVSRVPLNSAFVFDLPNY